MARLRLLPRDERFFELFEQAARIAGSSAETLQLMLADFDQASVYRQQISDLEHAGDSVIHEVIDKLNRTFVTPLDPEDIRAISSRLDDITDFVLAASERLALYHVVTPIASCAELCKVLVDAVHELQIVVTMLRDLSQKREILQHCIEINRLENVGDKVYREILSNLFLEANPMEVIRWKEIIEQIEHAIDECEDLAEVMESIVIKHS